ncbi:MAG: 16S rRNA (cytosine(1402)-N(4))-methyltransferase RsmH [Clostridia bacterium]|nr:16S rRNA (cytosine(1402)-N(4))-methyltransferase RsmH [Clostridia bacterium]
MAFHHIPVLFHEVMENLPQRPEGIFVDGTLGGGGHSEGILTRFPGSTLYGIDRDPNAIEAASERLKDFGGFTAIRGNFHDGKALLEEKGVTGVDCVLLDLGVSSPQLDDGSRGFSYHAQTPLDTRMDPSQPLSAADIVNTYSEQELTRIIREYGEDKWASRIAKMICEHREKAPLVTTSDLVDAVDAAIPKAVRRKDEGHPARRTFQAIRIAVNDELTPLEDALKDFVSILRPGGRLLVITFHSLEDRIVKNCFRKLHNPCTCPPKIPVCVCGKRPQVDLIGGAIAPSAAETEDNPRARSAKLRVCQKREDA